MIHMSNVISAPRRVKSSTKGDCCTANGEILLAATARHWQSPASPRAALWARMAGEAFTLSCLMALTRRRLPALRLASPDISSDRPSRSRPILSSAVL